MWKSVYLLIIYWLRPEWKRRFLSKFLMLGIGPVLNLAQNSGYDINSSSKTSVLGGRLRVIWTKKRKSDLMVDLWDAGIVLDAAVGVDSLLVHVAAPVIRGHYAAQLTIACSSINESPNEQSGRRWDLAYSKIRCLSTVYISQFHL